MLDLNVVFSVESTTDAAADSVTSTTTTTTTNNNAAGDELDCDSSLRSSNNAAAVSTTLNFSILNNANNDVIEIEGDDVANDVISSSDSMNELQLFPLGCGDGDSLASASPSSGVVRAKYWLNLSVPVAEMPAAASSNSNQVVQVQQPQVKKSRRGPRSRSSQYRGVTFYRRTGRWESHIWDCGKQVYLGGFDTAHAAARAYDRAAIKFRGVDADINFSITDYEEDMKQTKNLTKEEFVHILRRQSTGFSRGNSKYRGVTLHKCGRWEAHMGQFLGKKAYDKAAIQCNGRSAVTTFERSNYEREMNTSANNGGGGSNLDLNLGISLSADGPQGNGTTRNLQFPYALSELPDGKRVKVETTSASQQELAMAAKCAPMWVGVYSGFVPNNKEGATGMSGEAIPLHGFSNCSWKMPSHSVVAPVPFMSSSAASSGFSSATSPYPNLLMSLTPPRPPPQFSCFSQSSVTLNSNYNN